MPVFLGLEGEHESEQHGGRHVDPQDLHRQDRQARAEEDRRQDDEAFPQVGGQRPGDELDQVVEDAATLLDGGLDGGEVVVREDHVGRLFGDVRAVMPMAMPMSACLRAGASLTPSPVMATTWPRLCRASTSRSFCSGVTRAKTAVSVGPLDQLGVAERAQVAARRTGGCRQILLVRHETDHAWRSPRAVTAWSPVIILTRIPAVWQASIAAIASGRGGSIMACRPRNVRPGEVAVFQG